MSIILIIITLCFGFLLGYVCSSYINRGNRQEMENTFKAIASDVSKSNTEDFLKMANDKFDHLSKESDSNLEQKKKLISHLQ